MIGGRALGYKRAEKTFDDVKVKNFVIYGKSGSVAQTYAEKYKIKFVPK